MARAASLALVRTLAAKTSSNDHPVSAKAQSLIGNHTNQNANSRAPCCITKKNSKRVCPCIPALFQVCAVHAHRQNLWDAHVRPKCLPKRSLQQSLHPGGGQPQCLEKRRPPVTDLPILMCFETMAVWQQCTRHTPTCALTPPSIMHLLTDLAHKKKSRHLTYQRTLFPSCTMRRGQSKKTAPHNTL